MGGVSAGQRLPVHCTIPPVGSFETEGQFPPLSQGKVLVINTGPSLSLGEIWHLFFTEAHVPSTFHPPPKSPVGSETV